MKKIGIYIFFGLMALSACDLLQFERKNFITTGVADASKRDYTSAEITGLLRDVNRQNKNTQFWSAYDVLIFDVLVVSVMNVGSL